MRLPYSRLQFEHSRLLQKNPLDYSTEGYFVKKKKLIHRKWASVDFSLCNISGVYAEFN